MIQTILEKLASGRRPEQADLCALLEVPVGSAD